jgi:DNA-directed RNA polymerase subunit RPC12/RpoP
MSYTCVKCKQLFEKDGLEVAVHQEEIGRICPECLSGSSRISVHVTRESAGKPFVISYVEVEAEKQ